MTLTIDELKRGLPLDALGREHRTVALTTDSIVLRAADGAEDKGIGFAGHAAMFNSVTQIGSRSWGWREQIAPGAFTKTIQEADVRFLFNHNPDLVLARTKSGTLRLSEDKQGLAVDADLARTSVGEDLGILLERGDVTQMSFAFQVLKETWEEADNDEDLPLRTLQELKLWDVSSVTYPAYDDTDGGLRAVAEEVFARSLGLTSEQRKELDVFVTQIAQLNEPAQTTRSDVHPPAGETTGVTRAQLKAHQDLLALTLGLS